MIKQPSSSEISEDERNKKISMLLKQQNSKCYICGKEINLALEKVELDHIRSRVSGGIDDINNLAVTHSSCNRSKGSRDLELQRILHRFQEHVKKYTEDIEAETHRNFTVGNALQEIIPDRREVTVATERNETIALSFSINGNTVVERYPLIADENNPDVKSFVGMIPFKHIFHDQTMNPRSIVDLEQLIVEFYNKIPQLQPSLATLQINGATGSGKIMLFDGQHKAAAQLYLGCSRLFLRLFLNCDKGLLREANFRAHTKLAQIHFPQLTADKVGHDIFREELDKTLLKYNSNEIAEQQIFYEQNDTEVAKELQGYFKNFLKYEVLTAKYKNTDNPILNYLETVSPRAKKYPLSYEALEKGFFSHFISYKPASSLKLSETQRFRELERNNLVSLMALFVEVVLQGKYNFKIGGFKLEDKLYDAPGSVPENHIRAHRICRKAPMVIWMGQLKTALSNMLTYERKYRYADWPRDRVLWVELDDQDWKIVRKMFDVVAQHKIWIEQSNKEVLNALYSTAQRDWKELLLDGRLPGRVETIYTPLDHNYILKYAMEGQHL